MSDENPAWKVHLEVIRRELYLLSEECAKEPNQWLAIDDAEKAIYLVRKAFEQAIPKE